MCLLLVSQIDGIFFAPKAFLRFHLIIILPQSLHAAIKIADTDRIETHSKFYFLQLQTLSRISEAILTIVNINWNLRRYRKRRD